ncbi:MAG TPA: MoaD/ThiS family protein [Acidimicrobiales bacterium]|nr:MoaD/ThiS family protein [Acidimicrobiales bacterium]
MPVLRLFAAAREAAGVARAEIPGTTVAEILEHARARYGERFDAVLARSRVWVNGEPATADTVVHGHDVVAVLPPVSGGAGDLVVADRAPRPSPRGPARPPRGGPGGPPVEPRPSRPSGAGRGQPVETGAFAALGGLPTGQPAPDGAPASNGGPSRASAVVTVGGRSATTTLGPPPSAPDVARPPPPRTAKARAQGVRAVLGELAVTYDSTRPHGRIGLLWAVVTVVLTVQGEEWLAGWLALNAFVGGSQAAACRRALDQRPQPALAAALAAGAPVAALGGVRYVVGIVGLALALALLAATSGHGSRARDLAVTLAVGAVIGAAAAGPVVTRDLGIAPTLYLLACVAVYDAGAYLVGTGASSSWEGPVAGVVALIPVTLIGAIILSPPFPSGAPLALGVLAGVLAPAGPLVGTALVGSRDADAPGLRRLDSLILLGPAWAWWATSLIR